MSRTIIVLGVGRSGTSAVAGVLHRLGVWMGDEFMTQGRDGNATGEYEDRQMFRQTRDVLRGQCSSTEYRALVDARRDRAIWGVKDPALCYTAHLLWQYLDDARVIVVKRPPAESINSFMKMQNAGRRDAETWYHNTSQALAARVMEWEGPILDVDYHELCAEPEAQVGRIMQFAFAGMEKPDPAAWTAAVKSVRPRPAPEVRGWGRLGIGVRIGKLPETAFFCDWTALLTGGLRTGDRVLMPAAGMPAHWASDQLAHEFLKSDLDTLLMIDDDMTFPMDAVHRMRENTANWQYDVVMAWACRRSADEPAPVILWHMGNPPWPLSLRGDHFEHPPPEVQDGAVVEVDALGLAFTMIRRRVLEEMVDPEAGLEHTYDFFSYGPGRESDDIPFCRKCRELGFRMAIDTSVKIGHVAHIPLGWSDYQKWLEAQHGNA